MINVIFFLLSCICIELKTSEVEAGSRFVGNLGFYNALQEGKDFLMLKGVWASLFLKASNNAVNREDKRFCRCGYHFNVIHHGPIVQISGIGKSEK